MKIRELQESIREIDIKRFPQAPSYLALIKAQEELGELAGAFIAGFETRDGKELNDGQRFKDMCKEAADTIISLITFCEREGIDVEDAIDEKWNIVKSRNYRLIKQ